MKQYDEVIGAVVYYVWGINCHQGIVVSCDDSLIEIKYDDENNGKLVIVKDVILILFIKDYIFF